MAHPRSIKPDPYRPPTMEEVHRARSMYAEGFTVSRILAATDMALGTLYYWLDGGPVAGPPSSSLATSGRPEVAGGPLIGPATDKPAAGGENGGRMLPPIARRRVVVGKRRPPLSADRVSLAARLYRTAERQARDIEQHLARAETPPPERERDVRMLSVLVRTLRDLDHLAPPEGGPAKPAEPEEEPFDIDALRAELCRRVEGIRARRRAEEEARAAAAAQIGAD